MSLGDFRKMKSAKYYQVTLSDEVLRTITLATLEAYELGDGRKKLGLETLGYIWGYSRLDMQEETRFFHVEMSSVSLSAKRATDSVTPDDFALGLKKELLKRWAPHLTILGDFHSHPYRNLNEVDNEQGFEFSDEDAAAFLDDDEIWEESGNCPVMLVMTVCRLQKVNEKYSAEVVRDNITRFDVGEFRFWVNAAVGYLDENNKRNWTGNKYSQLELNLDSKFYNFSSDRLL